VVVGGFDVVEPPQSQPQPIVGRGRVALGQRSLDVVRATMSVAPRVGAKVRTGIQIYGRDEAREVVGAIGASTVVVLDAAAATNVAELHTVLRPAAGRLVITANHQEVARLLDRPPTDIATLDDLHLLAHRHDAVVVSFGDVIAPDGRRWSCTEGCAGLGTSGSGDVLAGVVAGLAARCGLADQAACWATYVHAATGPRLAASVHRLGFLAREIVDEIPAVLRDVEANADMGCT